MVAIVLDLMVRVPQPVGMADATVVGQVVAVDRMVGSFPAPGVPLSQFAPSSQFVLYPPVQFVCPHAPAAYKSSASAHNASLR
jgi:hypothetical protein